MPLACRYCIALKGLKGSDIDSLPETEEELARHVESEHHIPVRREGETGERALERFRRENPEAGTKHCRCPTCRDGREALGLVGDFLRSGVAHEGEAEDVDEYEEDGYEWNV